MRLEESLRVERDRPSLRLLGRRPEGFEVGVLAKSEEHLRPRRRVHDVVGLVLRVRETEDVSRVLLRRMALDREVAALERVQVVEADRERRCRSARRPPARGFVRPPPPSAARSPPRRLVAAEQEPALGRDQLVGPREVRRVGLDPEPASQPLAAPRPGQEGRPDAERPLREGPRATRGERRPRASAGSPDRRRRDSDRSAGGAPACGGRASASRRRGAAAPNRPRPPAGRRSRRAPSEPARGSATWERRRTRAGRASGARCRGRRRPSCRSATRSLRGPSTRSASSPSKIRAKTGSPGSTAADVRRSISSHDAKERRASSSSTSTSCAASASARACGKRVPGQCRRPVDGDHARSLPGDLGGQRVESALDRTPDDRVPRVGVVAHAGGRRSRSIVSAALHEKSRAPSGSPVVGS